MTYGDADEEHNCFSERGYKKALHAKMRGKAIEKIEGHIDLTLEKIITKMANQFESHKTKADYQEILDNYQRGSRKLLQVMEDLEDTILMMNRDSTEEEKKIILKWDCQSPTTNEGRSKFSTLYF